MDPRSLSTAVLPVIARVKRIHFVTPGMVSAMLKQPAWQQWKYLLNLAGFAIEPFPVKRTSTTPMNRSRILPTAINLEHTPMTRVDITAQLRQEGLDRRKEERAIGPFREGCIGHYDQYDAQEYGVLFPIGSDDLAMYTSDMYLPSGWKRWLMPGVTIGTIMHEHGRQHLLPQQVLEANRMYGQIIAVAGGARMRIPNEIAACFQFPGNVWLRPGPLAFGDLGNSIPLTMTVISAYKVDAALRIIKGEPPDNQSLESRQRNIIRCAMRCATIREAPLESVVDQEPGQHVSLPGPSQARTCRDPAPNYQAPANDIEPTLTYIQPHTRDRTQQALRAPSERLDVELNDEHAITMQAGQQDDAHPTQAPSPQVNIEVRPPNGPRFPVYIPIGCTNEMVYRIIEAYLDHDVARLLYMGKQIERNHGTTLLADQPTIFENARLRAGVNHHEPAHDPEYMMPGATDTVLESGAGTSSSSHQTWPAWPRVNQSCIEDSLS